MIESHEKIIRFAVMAKPEGLQKWQADCYYALIESGLAENVLWIVEKKEEEQKGFIGKIFSYPWKRLFFRKYYRYIFKPDSFRNIPLQEVSGEIPAIRCKTELKGKYSEFFSLEDLKIIKDYNPDFILKFGFGIIKGEILTCSRFGVWSFHHGDEQMYRGVPPGFHEIMKNDPLTGSILQRLTETLDGGVILRKGYFRTIKHSWAANLDQALKLSANWPLDVCREIIMQKSFPSTLEGVETHAPVYKEPENFSMFQFILKQFFNKIAFHLNEIFLPENWETGIIETRPENIIEQQGYKIKPNEVVWLSAGKRNRYFADSFVTKLNENLLLLFEDYDYKTQKAVISSAWFDGKNKTISSPSLSLQESWHLSYPFLFKSGKEIYCIPESIQHGSVELYRLNQETLKLEHEKTLIAGLKAADGTLVNHLNHWYFFFTPDYATNSELHIWHAETLEGPFRPHELNPVKTNAANARPAGPFFECENKLYRPAQDCSYTYGGRIIINEVKLLTESEFLEEPVNVLNPPKGYKGIHTLSFAGNFMYFDSKKFKFSPASFLHQMRRRIHS
ncbi:MAG: hypothetical protein K0B15_13385 [Lentimicrobium sp.]|nr:hypothetical protein [Lentimicrobium sp.]